MNKQISWTKVDYRAYVSFIVWRRASHPVMQHYRFPKLSSLCFFLFQSIFCKNFKKTAVSLTSTSTHHHPTAAQTFPQMIENTDKVLVLAFVMITVNVIWQNEAPTNGGQTRHNACECVFVFLRLSTQKITLGPCVIIYSVGSKPPSQSTNVWCLSPCTDTFGCYPQTTNRQTPAAWNLSNRGSRWVFLHSNHLFLAHIV